MCHPWQTNQLQRAKKSGGSRQQLQIVWFGDEVAEIRAASVIMVYETAP